MVAKFIILTTGLDQDWVVNVERIDDFREVSPGVCEINLSGSDTNPEKVFNSLAQINQMINCGVPVIEKFIRGQSSNRDNLETN